MTNKYMKMLLSVQIQCTHELLKVQEEDELVSVLHACIETWAKKTGYDALEIMNMLVSDEKMVREEIERNRQKQLQKDRKLLYNNLWKGGEPDERKNFKVPQRAWIKPGGFGKTVRDFSHNDCKN